MNNPYIKKLIEQKKNLQKKYLLEKADKKRVELTLERNMALNDELKREKERYEIEKKLKAEKRKLKKLMIKKANQDYNIEEQDGGDSISNLQRRREELISATKEYQNSLNIFNKSNYASNKDFKGRYSKYMNTIIHNKNLNNLKPIIKIPKKENKNFENKKEKRNLKFFTKVKVQEFDKKLNFKDINATNPYLDTLNDSVDY